MVCYPIFWREVTQTSSLCRAHSTMDWASPTKYRHHMLGLFLIQDWLTIHSSVANNRRWRHWKEAEWSPCAWHFLLAWNGCSVYEQLSCLSISCIMLIQIRCQVCPCPPTQAFANLQHASTTSLPDHVPSYFGACWALTCSKHRHSFSQSDIKLGRTSVHGSSIRCLLTPNSWVCALIGPPRWNTLPN